MRPDVVVDIGNTRMKWGLCAGGHVGEMVSFALDDMNAWDDQLDAWLIDDTAAWAGASVNPPVTALFLKWRRTKGGTFALFDAPSRLPIRTDVDEPDNVGIDRVLNALAASRRVAAGSPVVVIGIGSAMTVDYVDPDGVFRGGAILPGPWMMAHALHEFTAQLPLVEPRVVGPEHSVGRNTRAAVEAGIQAAIYGAADVLVWNIAHGIEQKLTVFVTGGGTDFARGITFSAELEEVVYDPLLTLEGIRLAAEAPR